MAVRDEGHLDVSTCAHLEGEDQCSLARPSECPLRGDIHSLWMFRKGLQHGFCSPACDDYPQQIASRHRTLAAVMGNSSHQGSSRRPKMARVKSLLRPSALVVQGASLNANATFRVTGDGVMQNLQHTLADEVVQNLQHAFEEGEPVYFVFGVCSDGTAVVESEEVMFMQRKRPRPASPRRRRRGRAERMEERSRQENRRQWTRGHDRGAPVTSTSSTARVPWRRGTATRGPTTTRPTSAPRTCGAASSSDVPIPRLCGEGSGNILWWGEIVGLQDPMEEQDTILPPEVVDNIASNLQEMTEARRTQMIAQIVPFLAAFLAELLRAVNMGCPVNVEEIEEDEGDECGLFQLGIASTVRPEADVLVLMQGAMAMGRFGGLLQQLQSLLEGQDSVQQQQAASHIAKLLVHLRQLAGDLSPQMADRFARLDALIACFHEGDVDVPLAMQLWAEGQLRRLTPLLGGATPTMPAEACGSDEVMTIEDSLPEGEVMIRRGPASAWEHATEEEKRELAAHEAQIKEDEDNQRKHDEYLFACQEAARAQDYEDWAVASELERPCPPPSKKRVRVEVSVGSSSGLEVGHAVIEGNLPMDQTALVTFQVQETVLGGCALQGGDEETCGLEQESAPTPMPRPDVQQAEDLEDIKVEELPELDASVRVVLMSDEARLWLRKLRRGDVSQQEVKNKFGDEVAEAMTMWLALQEDHERDVLNCGEHGVGYIAPGQGAASGSDSDSSSANSQASILTRPYAHAEGGALPCAEDSERVDQARDQGLSSGEVSGQRCAAEQVHRGEGTKGPYEGRGQGLPAASELPEQASELPEQAHSCGEAPSEPSERSGGCVRPENEGQSSLASGACEDQACGGDLLPGSSAIAEPCGSLPPFAVVEGDLEVADTVADGSHAPLSDGENTQPGNDLGGSATLSTEPPERRHRDRSRQADLRSWLKQ